MFFKLISGVIINIDQIVTIEPYNENKYLDRNDNLYKIVNVLRTTTKENWFATEEDMENIMKCIDLYEDNKEN